ncbi:MAG: hypothetical protein GXO91_05705 [FCB group bacterium]|nr:hypothetical protein [FCB group bacterium]
MNDRAKRMPTDDSYNKMRLVLIVVAFVISVSWAEEGFSGKVYFNWSNDMTEEADGYNEFTIKRTYFTFEKKINDNIKVKLTSDILKPSGDDAWHAYQKYACLQWNSELGEFLFGLQGMNVFNIPEKTWGYRFIEKSSMDNHKFASSAGMGIGFKRTLLKNVLLHLTITNGPGYKQSEDDKYKKIAILLMAGEKTLNKNPGYNAGLVFTTESYDYSTTLRSVSVVKNKTVIALFAGFAKAALRFGGDFSQFTNSGSEITEQIISFYGNYDLTALMSLYCLYDNFDPDVDLPGDEMTSIIAGVNLAPAKGLNIAPNIRYRAPETGKSELTELMLNFEFRF